MSFHLPLASLGLVVLAGSCLAAYLFGFESGLNAGRKEGHEKGKKDGAIRAFAVGYDRGKREGSEDEKKDDTSAEKATNPNFVVLFLIVVLTTLLLSIYVRH